MADSDRAECPRPCPIPDGATPVPRPLILGSVLLDAPVVQSQEPCDPIGHLGSQGSWLRIARSWLYAEPLGVGAACVQAHDLLQLAGRGPTCGKAVPGRELAGAATGRCDDSGLGPAGVLPREHVMTAVRLGQLLEGNLRIYLVCIHGRHRADDPEGERRAGRPRRLAASSTVA